MRSTPCPVPLLAATAMLLTGCAVNTYLDAKRNTAPGGPQEAEIAARKREVATLETRNAEMKDEAALADREIERNNTRIRALESELRTVNARLDSALKARRVSQQRYNELKREMDSVKREMQAVELQNKGDALAAPDPKSGLEKEAKLKDLERRKKDLENAVAALAKG